MCNLLKSQFHGNITSLCIPVFLYVGITFVWAVLFIKLIYSSSLYFLLFFCVLHYNFIAVAIFICIKFSPINCLDCANVQCENQVVKMSSQKHINNLINLIIFHLFVLHSVSLLLQIFYFHFYCYWSKSI